MTDKKQIEEMARSCCSRAYKTCKECIKESEKILGKVDIYECECYSYASRFFNKGYHKTIWHKVADGDLPKKTSLYLCKMIYEETYNYEYKVLLFNTIYGFHDNGLSIANDTVIAWTELAKYEE